MLRFSTVGFVALMLVGLSTQSEGKILGVFQGKIIRSSSVGGKKYLYVQGKSGFVRKVDIGHATVEYDDDFPVGIRATKPMDSLIIAANVRITAEQKKQVWQASEIVILAPGDAEHPRRSAALTPSQTLF